ncbi:MAG: hypothetical protein ACTHKJ_11260, partial [Candidatus Nitrosocosmicus sp.]
MKKNTINLIDIFDSKEIVSVAVLIAITGMMVFSSAFVNPLWAKSSKHEDKSPSNSVDKKSNPTTATTTTATTSTTPSTASGQSDYKNFQKCLSSAAAKQGFATKTDIQSCYKPIYSPSSTLGTNSSTPTSFNQDLAP